MCECIDDGRHCNRTLSICWLTCLEITLHEFICNLRTVCLKTFRLRGIHSMQFDSKVGETGTGWISSLCSSAKE